MAIDKEGLYALTPTEFNRLCANLLQVLGVADVRIIDGPGDQGIDIIGTANGLRVAAQIKHTKRMDSANIRRIISQMRLSSYSPQQIFLITSAELSAAQMREADKLPDNIQVRLIGQTEILRALNEHPDIGGWAVSHAEKRSRREIIKLASGALVSAASIAAIIASLAGAYFGRSTAPLRERITTVEKAIDSLKDLEQNLADIKRDMEETRHAKKALDDEYTKAKELEKLTDAQLEAVKTALKTEGLWTTIFDYVMGFVFGFASSFVASVLYDKWRQRRALGQ